MMSPYSANTLGTKGELTLVRKFIFGITPTPPRLALCHDPMPTSDVTYGYDNWGNQTTVTTYAANGRIDDPEGTTPTYRIPTYGGNTARTTTTTL